MGMKFGLFALPSWLEGDASQQSRIFGEMLEQVQFAEELGFDAVWLAEQHFTRYCICPNALSIAIYVAAHTKKIRIGTAVTVLTFRNPILVAEEAALVDVLSNGRLDFGLGRGSVAYEYGNFHVDFDSRTKRFQESLDIILGLWTTPGFTYQGEYNHVDDLTIAPSPVQRPHPPVYIAVTKTAATVDAAISRDLPLLSAYALPEESTLGFLHWYYDRCAAAGKTPLVDQMPYFRIVYVAEDEKQAIEDPQSGVTWINDLSSMRRTLTKGSEINMDLDQWRRTRPEEPESYESLLKSNVYFGTPEECVRRIRRLQEEHNIQYFGAFMGFGALAHSKVMRSMELFAKEVMPHFR